MRDAPLGHNGGPLLHKLTTKQKVELIRRIMEMPDLTAAQKCVGVGIVVEADREGSAEVTTKRLQAFASVSDRETVYRATKVLATKNVIQTIKEKGKPNRFRVMPTHVTEAIIEAFHEKRGSRVEPDGLQDGHAVGFDRTSQDQPVGFDRTSRVEPDGLQPTGAKESFPPHPPSKKITTTRGEVENTSAQARAHTREADPVVVNCEAIHGPNFTLSFAAIDQAAALSGISKERARGIAEIIARDWASNGQKPQSPMAVVRRAIQNDRNSEEIHQAQLSKARSGGSAMRTLPR